MKIGFLITVYSFETIIFIAQVKTLVVINLKKKKKLIDGEFFPFSLFFILLSSWARLHLVIYIYIIFVYVLLLIIGTYKHYDDVQRRKKKKIIFPFSPFLNT